MMARCRTFFGKPFFSDYRTLLALWMIIAVIGIKSIGHAGGNNYLIFKYVFWHVVEQVNLYMPDPVHYFDVNHYGPVLIGHRPVCCHADVARHAAVEHLPRVRLVACRSAQWDDPLSADLHLLVLVP